MPYLTPASVADTVRVVTERSAPGSRLVLTYNERTLGVALSRGTARVLMRLARRPDPLAGEPWRSSGTPSSMGPLLAGHGWTVTSDEDLLAVATRLSAPVGQRGTLGTAHVAVADRP